MTYTTLHVEVEDGAARVALDRPEVLNALSLELLAELRDALQQLGDDPEVRALLLTGRGRGFCSGADLASTTLSADVGATIEEFYNPVARLITTLPKPVIAAVNGVAAGAGMSLALCCDLRLLSTNAAFALGFTGIALVMDASASYYLPRLVGRARALELAYSNRKVGAEEALRLGLGEVVLGAETFEEESWAYAKRLAQGPTRTFGLVKRQVDASAHNDLEAQLALEAELQGEAAASADAAEGVSAFKEKRRPAFVGR